MQALDASVVESGTEALSHLFPDFVASSKSLDVPEHIRAHLRGQAGANWSFADDWLWRVFGEGRCAATGEPIGECCGCKPLKGDGGGRLNRERIRRSRFTSGSSNRVGPHLPELLEAMLAILVGNATLYALARQESY